MATIQRGKPNKGRFWERQAVFLFLNEIKIDFSLLPCHVSALRGMTAQGRRKLKILIQIASNPFA